MLSFEIEQRESGFYSEWTDRITEPSSTVLLYIYTLLFTVACRIKGEKILRTTFHRPFASRFTLVYINMIIYKLELDCTEITKLS